MGAGCESFSGDESEQEPVVPDVVVLAETEADVLATLRVAQACGVPVTPRAAGSGKSGGAVPVHGGIVLSTLGMGGIEDIDTDNMTAVVGPGVILADFHRAVEAEGAFYPPDPNSSALCALGGNIAENAAGPRALKYGATRDYVLGLEVATVSGERLSIGRRTHKGVTGYDLTSLLVGSEGTLAVTLRARVKLLPKPDQVITLLALFGDALSCSRAVIALCKQGPLPRCAELLDAATLQAMRDAGVAIDASANAMLIIETDDLAAELHAERLGEACMAAGAQNVLVAQDEAQRSRIWESRKKMSFATRAMAKFKISEDVVVPRARVPFLIERVQEIGGCTSIKTLTYGHAGDGNLHCNFLWNNPEEAPQVEKALGLLFHEVIQMGGTLSGEHGIGTSKLQYLPLEQPSSVIALQQSLKAVFDPKGLLNPGKIFAGGLHRGC